MKTIWKAMFVLLMVIGSILPVQAEEKSITMGTMAWEDMSPMALITKKVLEDQGYTVKLTEFSEWGIAYAALGKGDIQLLVSQVNYLAQDYWNKSKNRLERISPVSDGLYQGIAVPKYVTVDSIEELNANADKFGGKIIGIEPGAGLMRDASKAVKDYGLKLQLVEGSSAAMTAALKSSIDRKEWIAVTLWDPSWMSMKFDVKYLKDPKGVFPPSQTYYWIAQKGFSEKNPQAREIIASIFIPIADIRAINGEINDGKSVDEAAKSWMAKNTDLIGRWANNKKN
ncbi:MULTISPECIES: glycine betaine ABC transporter substrate-binding protein [unclassified Pseudomonas]|uniref:glycine betaine ABC transporter substrate-binding protein n=1 Tax=unclassified Pseudomonas TaxID=196821 RepID=UPI0011A69523|nr:MULTISPECIES: glycine betaine ABC transporter substrate-binding protein [unclassified Pseudomonas]TWC22272.1 glycine betaine/proline transport system substrate-binding protein [Pseudomonas sp. SJZ083]TWC48743.1 glycine betaine/proline transport system substrate-binding protein [Pseudomonas sp. SJZ077]